MTSVKISALPEAATIAGGELLPIVQNGETRRATASQIATLTGALLPDNNLSDVPNDELAAENLSVSFVVADLAALKALGSRPEVVIVETGQAKGVWQWEAGSSTTADDALVVNPTSGTAGRYKRVYDGPINLAWFGVATSATGTVNAAALTAAAAVGATMLLPDGEFSFDPISITSDFSLVGNGDRSIFKWASAAEDTALITFETNALRAEFRNLKVDGNRQGHTEDATYRSTILYDAPASGVSGSRIRIENCTFVNGRDHDVWVFGSLSAGEWVKAEIVDCRFSDGLESTASKLAACIAVNDDVDFLVDACTFDGPTANSIGRSGIRYSQSTSDVPTQQGAVTVIGSTLRNMGYNDSDSIGAIDIYSGASAVTIADNRIIDPYGRGIGAKADQSDVNITGNVVTGLQGANATACITFFNSTTTAAGKRCVISSNTCLASVGHGIFIDGSNAGASTTPDFEDISVTDNIVYPATASNGIHFRYVNGAKVSDNIIRGGTDGITGASLSAETVSLTGNDIRGTSSHGINIGGSQTSANYQISDNYIASAGGRGISVATVNSVQIRGNTIKDSGNGAIIVTAVTVESVIECNTTIDCNFAWTLPSNAKLIERNNIWDPAPGFSSKTVTIASGAITIIGEWHQVETEGAAATDDLDTINGGYDGRIVTLKAVNSARDVVVKDGTNLKLAGDMTLNNVEDTITLRYMGGTWFELCRSDNGA